MKKLFISLAVISVMACNEEVPELKTTNSNKNPNHLSYLAECNLASGYTHCDNTSMKLGETREFAIQNNSGDVYEWNYSSKDFQIVDGSNTNKIVLKAIRETLYTCLTVSTKALNEHGQEQLICERSGCLSVSNEDEVDDCPCTDPPVINVTSCDSNGDPYWEFNVLGVTPLEEIRWYGDDEEMKFHGSIKKDSVAVEPTDEGKGFRLYCEVTNSCGKKRTSWYENYEGGTCANNSGTDRGKLSCVSVGDTEGGGIGD